MTYGPGVVLLALAVSVAIYALLVEPLLCQLVKIDIPAEALPAGLRILFLSDMHHHRWGKREEAFIRSLPDVHVDVVVFGGDFLGSKHGIDASLKFIDHVSNRYPHAPMFGVCGNAEHKLIPGLRINFLQELTRVGVVVLQNSNTTICVDGKDIGVIGTDDPYYGFHDLDAAFSGMDPRLPKILITHSPQVIRSSVTYTPDIVLSGHTHGGQVRIPGIGPIRTQNPLSRKIAMGLFSPQNLQDLLKLESDVPTWLYVSRGLGLAFVPHMRWLAPRFLCRPEVTLITISR